MSSTTNPVVQHCAAGLTDDPDTIIINPASGLPVETRPLFTDSPMLAAPVTGCLSAMGRTGGGLTSGQWIHQGVGCRGVELMARDAAMAG
jgi:hypothetical protein